MISNESAQDFYATIVPSILHPQTAGGNTWISMVKDEYLLVPAGKSVWLERTVPAEYTVAASAGKWDSKDYTYGSYFIRVNVSADAEGKTALPKGTVFVLSGNEKIESGCMSTSSGQYTVNAVTQLPESVKDPYVPEVKAAEVVNGNAEAGTTGWGVFFGGSIEQVAGGADGTAMPLSSRLEKINIIPSLLILVLRLFRMRKMAMREPAQESTPSASGLRLIV